MPNSRISRNHLVTINIERVLRVFMLTQPFSLPWHHHRRSSAVLSGNPCALRHQPSNSLRTCKCNTFTRLQCSMQCVCVCRWLMMTWLHFSPRRMQTVWHMVILIWVARCWCKIVQKSLLPQHEAAEIYVCCATKCCSTRLCYLMVFQEALSHNTDIRQHSNDSRLKTSFTYAERAFASLYLYFSF